MNDNVCRSPRSFDIIIKYPDRNVRSGREPTNPLISRKKTIRHNFAPELEFAACRDLFGGPMGAWALFGSGFFVGLCVGQLALAFFLGLTRKDHPDIFPALERES